MERLYELKLTGEELDIIITLLNHEKEYYESEDGYDKDYIEVLQNILDKIEEAK